MKCNFFIIGASKCGTTSLYNILNNHPEICMTSTKETDFFADSQAQKKYDRYSLYFNRCTNEKIFGEACPTYSELNILPWVPKNIFDYNKNSKIIYVVRNPIERIKSVWKQTLNTGHWYKKVYKKRFGLDIPKMSLDFEKAVFKYPPFIEACKYWTQIQGYRKYFPDEQIKVMYFEDFVNTPDIFLNNIINFLNVTSHDFSNIQLHYNKSDQKTMLKPNIKYVNAVKILRITLKIPLPVSIRRKIKNIMYINVPNEIKIDPVLKNKIIEQLKEEIENITDYIGKVHESWESYI